MKTARQVIQMLVVVFVPLVVVGCSGVGSVGPFAPESVPSAEEIIAATKPVAGNLAKVNLNGKTYYLDVVVSGSNAGVWFRVYPNACSNNDIKAMSLQAVKTTLGQAKRQFCTIKGYYDGGKTVAGCISVGISAGCAAAAVATDGAAAAFCTAAFAPSLSYAFKRGAADCIEGLSDLIASRLIGDRNWAAVRTAVSISEARWKDAIDKGIDVACASAR